MKTSIWMLALLTTLASCASAPPVWRTPAYATGESVPTLAAASVYDYYIPQSETVVLDNVDSDTLKLMGEALVEYAKENPDEVVKGVMEAKAAYDRMSLSERAVVDAAPAMHAKAKVIFGELGFPLEFDRERTRNLEDDGMAPGHFTYVEPETSASPFGEFPLFGPGSKSSIAERLQSGRAREAYASLHAALRFEGDDSERNASCALHIQILDQAGTLVFEGKTQGAGAAAPGRPAKDVLVLAFQDALQGMRFPETYE